MRGTCATGLVAALLIAGCGGADDSLVDPDADRELIENSLFTVDDLPEGFEEEPVDDENDDSPCNEEVLGLDERTVDRAKTADETVQFQSPTLSIRAQVTAFESDDIPRQILDGFDDEYIDCLVDEFAENADGATVTDIDRDDLPIDDDDIDAGLMLRFGIDVGGTAAVAHTYLALVDRYAIALDFTALPDDMDEDLAEDLLSDMVARLSDG